MALEPGTRLGTFEVLSPLGAGGMGEVYRAHDTELGREVALKLLPENLADDPERLARLKREARALAALNHPGIATVHEIGEAEGTSFLVMELVEGPTLAERLKRGALPVDEALELGRQIAAALEAAHEKAIIHRDLKPANIKLTKEGRVKLLDFGLAKVTALGALEREGPTATPEGTAAGVVMGTAAYMSPEQARGQELDRRTDVWSFGCVLHEMLTGQRAFPADTVSDALAGVLEHEPDWGALPGATPALVRSLLRRCLKKDRAKRLHDIADARIEIDEALAEPLSGAPRERPAAGPRTRRVRWAIVLPWALAATLAVLAVLRPGRPGADGARPAGPIQLSIPTAGWELAVDFKDNPLLDVSRDGRQVVFASGSGTSPQLYLRRLDSVAVRPVAGTEGATNPVFSPDGQWIAFFDDGKLKKASTTGSKILEICDAEVANRGAAWGEDGRIVFSPGYQSGLMEVAASGGSPRPFTELDAEAGERTHRWPQVLSGGEFVLFSVGDIDSPSDYDDASLVVHSRRSGRRKTVLKGGTMGRYLASGHLAFLRAGVLFAVPFDLDRLEPSGDPVAVSEAIGSEPSSGVGYFAVSENGVLAYLPTGSLHAEMRLVLADLEGNLTPLDLPPRRYNSPRFSPDGQRIAYYLGRGGGGDDSIWIYDLETELTRRLTFGQSEMVPVWSPDGQRVYYSSVRGGTGEQGIYSKAADGSGAEQRVFSSDIVVLLSEVVESERRLLMTRYSPTIRNIEVTLSSDGTLEQRLLGTDQGYQWGARLSPNGRWLAYTSNETGRDEVYVEPAEGNGRWQVSTEGGMAPVWGPEGRTLFFADFRGLYRVGIRTADRFEAGRPERLFEGRFNVETAPTSNFDVSPRGDGFVLVQPEELDRPREVLVTLDWFPELERLFRDGR